jgi:hypothetical protein
VSETARTLCAAQTAGQLEELGAGALSIQKPFAADARLRVVREALDAGP